MANRNAKDVKRFVDGISKEVGEKAYDPTEYATKEYVDETFEKKADVVEVIANPTLVGDEPNLEGLQVDGNKYKVSSGGGVEFVPIDIDATSIDQETLEKLVDFNNNTLKPNFIVLGTDNETDTFPILMPSDNLQCIYRSAVMGDKYYQLTLHFNEEGADVNIEQISVGGGGGIDNLCDYYPNLAKINGKQRFSDRYNYYLDVEGLVQYVEDSGIGDIPFEPNIKDTFPNGVELITSGGGIVSELNVHLQTQTSNSNSHLSIDFAGNTVNVEDLINNEGDTLAVFLTRNKNAIKEVFGGATFSGSSIRNMLDSITSNEMCICRAWERMDTDQTFVHSMNFMKFLELFHR